MNFSISIGKGNWRANKKRVELYCWLAEQLGISVSECHFGYFDLDMLKKAYRVLKSIQGKEMKYDRKGEIYFIEVEE